MSALIYNFPRFWYLYCPLALATLVLVLPVLPALWRQRGKVMAVAVLSFRESVRKKALVAGAIAALVVLSSTPFIQALGEPGAKLKMVQLVCIIALNIFGCLVAVVLGAFSLPVDIADKTIYSVVTKPVRRETLVAGKILGLAGVTLLAFTGVAIVSIAAIELAAANEPQRDTVARLLSGRRYVEAGQIETFGENVQRNPYGQIWVPAQTAGALWSFEALHDYGMPKDTVRAGVLAVISTADANRDTVSVTASISNPSTGDTVDIPNVQVKDMIITPFEFPASLVSDEGGLEISLTADQAGDWLALAETGSLRLEARPGGFVPNFIRAMLMLACQCALIVVMAVAGSTFLSARVSVLFAVFVVFCGYINDFVRDLAKGAFVVIPAPHVHGAQQVEPPSLIATFFNTAAKEFLNLFSAVAPDFREFAIGPYLIDGLYLPPSVLCQAIGYMLIYGLIAFAFARAVMVFREID